MGHEAKMRAEAREQITENLRALVDVLLDSANHGATALDLPLTRAVVLIEVTDPSGDYHWIEAGYTTRRGDEEGDASHAHAVRLMASTIRSKCERYGINAKAAAELVLGYELVAGPPPVAPDSRRKPATPETRPSRQRGQRRRKRHG